jgi:hypothetical protein
MRSKAIRIKFLFVMLLFIAPINSIHAVNLLDQDPILPCRNLLEVAIDRSDARSIYFDRWNLARGVAADSVLSQLIHEQSAKGPVVIMDTNPSAKTWQPQNIFTAEADRLMPNRKYSQLTDGEKAALYQNFLERISAQHAQRESLVLFFDHHFDSHLLLDASTTPIVVDFLLWLQEQKSDKALEMHQILRNSTILRDHSDADIVLANFAMGLLDQPELLRQWAPLLRSIALYNDHLYLSPSQTTLQQTEALAGYELLLAMEKWIPTQPPGGFVQGLSMIPHVLELVQTFARLNIPAGSDVLPEIIAAWPQLETRLTAPLAQILPQLEENWQNRQNLQKLMTQADFKTFDDVLLVHFPPLTGPKVSNVDLIRYLEADRRDLVTGMRVLVVLSSRAEQPEVYSVKIRALGAAVDLTPIFQKMLGLGYPGGGRAGAGSFTWDLSSSPHPTEDVLQSRLAELMASLHQLPRH